MVSLGPIQNCEELRQLVGKTRLPEARQPLASRSQIDAHDSPILVVTAATNESPLLSTADQATDTRLVESEEARQFVHGRGAVAEDAKQADLLHRQAVRCSELFEARLHPEGEPHQEIDRSAVLVIRTIGTPRFNVGTVGHLEDDSTC